jgi:hypothetical protein
VITHPHPCSKESFNNCYINIVFYLPFKALLSIFFAPHFTCYIHDPMINIMLLSIAKLASKVDLKILYRNIRKI